MSEALRSKLYVLDGKIINVGEWDLRPEKVTVDNRVPDPRDAEYAQAQAAYDYMIAEGDDPIAAKLAYDGEVAEIAKRPHTEHGFTVETTETGEIVFRNPIPDGAQVIEDGEYMVTADQKIVLASDHAALRRAEYPPITDYLDAVVKGDEPAITAYKAACLGVKAKYPKRHL